MNRKSILIIDDNIVLSKQMAERIKREKEYVILGIAENGKDGLEIVKANKPDIIILDMIMPHLDGIGVLDNIYSLYKQDEKKPVIIMASAIGRDIVLQKLRTYNIKNFLQKPFDLDELIKTINNAVLERDKESEFDEERLEYKIGFILREIGIVSNLRGYNFLIDSVEYMINNMGKHVNFCTEIYIPLSKKYDTSSANVEKSISRLIENNIEKASFKEFIKEYKSKDQIKKSKPTNKELVKIITDIVYSTL